MTKPKPSRQDREKADIMRHRSGRFVGPMATQLGTLTGLIADLEELHNRRESASSPICGECQESQGGGSVEWPCPTMEIVQRHKRAQYLIIPEGSDPPEFADVHSVLPGLPQIGPTLFEGTTPAECEAWIEEQINSSRHQT